MTRAPWILESKLAAPAWPADGLTRALLPAHAPLPPVTLLVAGAGYGKTLAMSALVASAPSDALRIWVSLDPSDADLATFFHYMIAGVRAHIPQFGSEIEALLLGDSPDPRRLWLHFFQALTSYNLPALVLALDDFHHLLTGCPELARALVEVLDKLPPGVHVLLTSRKRLPAGLARLTARGVVKLLEPEQLRFSPDEEQAFLAARAPGGRIPDHWLDQAARLDGWPLGLELVTLGTGLALDASAASQSPALMTYVAEELYATLDPERAQFLLKASLLQELTPEACRQVLDEPEAARHLEALEADHLVQRLGPTYRLPAYFRTFLSAEAERVLPGLSFKAWHRQAASYYQERRQHELAIPHLLAVKDWGGALVECPASFPAMRYDGRQGLIDRWLASFPAEVAGTEPLLPLWRGLIHARRGAHPDALAAYEQAYRLFTDRDDPEGAFKALVQICNVLLIQEDLKRFGQRMMQALARQAEGHDEDRVDLHLIRARSAEARGDLPLMQECNQEVLTVAIAGNVEIAASQVIARLNLFTLAHHQGDLDAALRHLDQAIEVATEHRFHPYRLFASFLRAHLQLMAGEAEGAAAFLTGLPPRWTELLDWHDQACAWIVFGYWHQGKGEYKEAEDAYKRSLAIFEKAGHREGKKVPLERLLVLAVGRRQYVKAHDYLAEIRADRPDWPDAEALRSVHDLALAVPHARALHQQDDSAQAIALLHKILPALDEMGARLHSVRARLYLAASQLKVGDPDAARAAYTQAMAQGADYPFLLNQDRELWDELAPLRESPESRVLSPRSGEDVLEVVIPAADPAPELRTQDLGLRTPAATLAIHCFGTFEARLAGVSLDQWPRRKSKLILAALLLYPRGLSLPELGELLGPDEGGSASSLKMSVSALRKVLEPQLDSREPSKYLKLVDERYVLEWDMIASVDVREFEAGVREGDRLRESEPVAAAGAYEAAIAHCRGPLLTDALFHGAFEAERNQLRHQAVTTLMWLSNFHQGLGDFSRAEAALIRAAELAPTEEDVYLALMRFYQARGRVERIRQVYWDCRKALKAHLGLTPSEEFEAMHKAIASGGVTAI